MFLSGIKRILRSVPASLIACAVFLLPVENAFAAANITLSTVFDPVDNARELPPYMDRAGTWNGSADVTDDTGDWFILSVENIGTVALDIDIDVDVPNGFRLPYNNFPLNVTSPNGCNTFSGVTNFTGIDVSQSGNRINFNIPNNRNIPANCIYDFKIGITTDYLGPTANIGTNNIDYDFTYDDNAGTGYLDEITHQVEVYGTSLSLEKTAIDTSAVNNDPVSFNLKITNVGTIGTDGGLFDLYFTDFLGMNLSGIQINVPAPYVNPPFGQSFFEFEGYFPPGASVSFTVDSTVNVPPDDTTCSIRNSGIVRDRAAQVNASGFDSIPYDLTGVLALAHDTSSYCLLCGEGEVILRVVNTGGITLDNVTVKDTINIASGLEYVPGSATFTIIGDGSFGITPTEISTNPTTTPEWNIGSLDSPLDGSNSNPVEVEIRFRVRRGSSSTQEGLAESTLIRTVQANATYTSICGDSSNPLDITSGLIPDTLLFRQPEPVVTKLGWNVDAGQTEATAADFVFGHEDDDIIWRIDVRNNGAANLEDLMVSDTIGGNFIFTAVCSDAAGATAAAGGSIGATCETRGPTAAPPFLPPLPFVPPLNSGIDVGIAGNGYVYYVGRILASCSNADNTATIQWGCDADGTDGGIGSIGDPVGPVRSSIADANVTDTAGLNTAVAGDDLTGAVGVAPGGIAANTLGVNVQFTGIDPANFGPTAQPAGSRGRVTITITNNTGGTVRDIDLEDVLPVGQYVIDPTIPTVATLATNNPQFDITITPANSVASYPGMIDRVTWTNPVTIVDPKVDPLSNTAPQFTFDSIPTGPTGDEYRTNMLRHGDVLTLSFDVVLIDSSRYDLLADLDIPEELDGVDDPAIGGGFAISNDLTVTFEDACDAPDRRSLPLITDTFTAFPEDIDLQIIDPISGLPSLEFILNANPIYPLDLRVQLINRGGHDARDYFSVVTFGNAMVVDSFPANCVDVSSPQNLPRPYWDDPVPIPSVTEAPTIFRCDYEGFGAIAPGATLNLDFRVTRDDPITTDDDLTFRVDVVGEIQLSDRSAPGLSDGTPLIFPAVTTVPIVNEANNYTLDALRAKVIGFGLTKVLEGDCTEDASFLPRNADAVFIGEDCKFKINSGGWFGFDTPGFGIIAIHNILVTDTTPNGQGFISQTDGGITTVGGGSDTEIKNIQFGSGSPFVVGAVPQLTEDVFGWTFNPVTDKLIDKDKYFRTDITTRILNDAVDDVTGPNQHQAPSTNVVNTTFDADFDTGTGSGVISFGPATPGYPAVDLRDETLIITEPNIVITKDVCNETLAGGLCADTDFGDYVDTGDTDDLYVYRIKIENLDDSVATGVTRAPAYNIVVIDTLDATDLMQIYPALDPFNNDFLDNDGDGIDDPTDSNEAEILTDNIVNDSGNIDPAKIKFSYTTSTALEQLNPGDPAVYLYYRVNPYDSIAPLQLLTNTVEIKYDSLKGLHGSQNPQEFDTDPDTNLDGTIGSARVYTNTGETARVRIQPLEVERKILVQTATQPGAGPLADLTGVVVGEEIEFKLRTLLPVANLREFKVRDELPPGLSCADVPDVDLNLTGPHAAAKFNPGGLFEIGNGITCTDNLVEWNFGDQELTGSLSTRYTFEISFIARVENTALTNVTPFQPVNPGANNCILRNGGAAVTNLAPPQTCDQDTYVVTSYVNDPTQGSELIKHLFDPIQVTVREPQLVITKTFYEVNSGAPGTQETAGDAKDVFEVRVNIENIGDAPAHNPQILDNLINTKYTYLGNIGGTDPPLTDGISFPLPLTVAGLPPAGLPASNQPVFSWPANYTILSGAGNSISFSYRVESNDDVNALEDLVNTINAKWSSLEDNTVALNRSGSIGADGAIDGMRIGYLPGIDAVPANTQNDYIDDNADSITVPGLTVFKNDLDLVPDITDTQRTIGEHRRFEIEIRLPEGITNGVRIDDNLAFGDESYIFEKLQPYEVQYQFFDIKTINGVVPVDGSTSTSNAETIFTAISPDQTPVTAIWDIGTVATVTEDDSPLNVTPTVNPRILITYYARVNNDLATNAVDNDNLRNRATLQYANAVAPLPFYDTDDVKVIEPELNIDKVADISSGDAGDVITYTVTISHDAVSNANAYDLNIVDNLPANVTFVSATSLQVNGADKGTLAPVVSGQQLIWGRGNSDDELDIPLTESLVLVYTVTINNTVQPLEEVTNNIVVDWTSINSASDGSTPEIETRERYGIGGADCSASVAPNDYCAVPDNLPTVTIVDANTIVKTISFDSFSLAAGGTDVRIGDIVEYTLTLTLQEGTSRGVTLVDTLPNGLEFLNVVSVNGNVAPYLSANGFTHDEISAPTLNPTTGGAGNNTLRWVIDDPATGSGIVNEPGGLSDFVIIYRAVVTKDEFVLPQLATTAIDNTVVLNYQDFSGAAPSGAPLSRLSSTVNLNAQQPVIFTANILKDRYPSGIASGSSVASDAEIDFRLLACNVGTAPAYDVLLVDKLPVEMNRTTIANLDIDYTDSTGVTQLTQLVATTDYTYTPPAVDGGDMTFVFNNLANPLLPDQCIRVMFDINVVSPIGINFSWANEFRVDDYFSLDADDPNAIVIERQDYVAAGPVFYNMNTVSPNNPPDKSLLGPLNTSDTDHDEATIGELVTYQIIVPSDDDDPLVAPNPNPMTADLFQVRVEDTLSSHLSFVSATLDNTNPAWYSQPGPLTTSVGAGNVLTITLDPTLFLSTSSGATQPAVINVTTRVVNLPATNSSVAEFNNIARYWFKRSFTDTTEIPGGFDITPAVDDLSIVEPEIVLIDKIVSNETQAEADTNAGDILRYTLTFSTSGGAANDAFSDAFDVSIIDTLDPGLNYCSQAEDLNCPDPTSSVGIMEANSAAIVSGTGTIADPHIISWNSLNSSNTDIDVQEGTALVTITYYVKVMDEVLANQSVNSSTLVRWTSLDGAFEPDERTYTATIASSPSLTVPIVNDLSKALDNTTSTLTGSNVRIGDVVDYKLEMHLQEGTSQNVKFVDTLSQGFQYEGIVSVTINSIVDNDGSFEAIAPASPVRFGTFDQTRASVTGNPLTGPTEVTISLGDVVNTGNNDPVDDKLIIVYRARVLDLVQTPLDDPNSNIDLQNSVDLQYGRSPVGTISEDLDNTVIVNIDQPNISVVKQFLPVVYPLPLPAQDTIIEASEVLNFSLEINNTTGQSPAYDLVVQDILPNGLRDTPPLITSIVKDGVTLPATVRPVQTYNLITGELLWDFNTGGVNDLTIQPGEIVTVNYQVAADSDIGAGLSLDNQAQALRYHSFDDEQIPQPVNATTGATAETQIVPPEVADREVYGPSNTSIVNLTTDTPEALSKTEQADDLISIGETFSYIIKVPDALVNTALHDVRITDNLAASGVDLFYVSAEAVDAAGDPDPTATYTPVNTSGDLTSLVIEDVSNGIEIPANESIYIKLSVIMLNQPGNSGLPLPADTFTNAATYTFNSVDNDDTSRGNGDQGVSGVLTIVEPNLSIVKTGPSVPDNIVYFNTPILYTLEVVNTGTGPAFDTTITDILPQAADNLPLTGGICNVAPDPANIHAQVFDSAGVAFIDRPELVQGVDYTVSWAPAPDCELVITTLTPAARIETTEKFIITYEALLDVDSMNGAELTNTASVTQYFSQDTPAGLRVGQIRSYPETLTPIESDSYTVIVAAAELVMTKVATDNLTAGGSGAFADPGDKLHYTISILNIGPAPTGLFSFTDQPDRLNLAPGYFDFASLSDVLLDGVAVPYTATGGVLTIPDLTLTEELGAKNSLTIEFNINLNPVIDAGLTVLNQGEVTITGFSAIPTDDPSIAGTTDPTETLIDAAPAFQVTKRSADISNDVSILRQGDTLRYTLQIKNIGLENVTNAYLRDLIPANTHYVLGTTRLNGVVVADVNGTSALENEMLINAPENTTPGYMRADPSAAVTSNVATITFDVTVDADVIDGTVISNQGYVGGLGAGSGPFAEQASNDPDTTLANDPTIDVVGNLPALDAQKIVSLFTDVAGNGFVDTGDVLEYTIVVANGGAVAATEVSLIDAIPANSSYVANSVSLNGTAIPDVNLVSSSPLTVRLNSSDLGLPDQAANDGQITAGNEATITFRVLVTGAVSSLISNQGSIISSQLPVQLTDADGNAGNGAQRTDIYVGANSKLELTKEVYVVGGGVALAGGTLEYIIQVQNTGQGNASNIVLIDDIDGLDGAAIVSYEYGLTKLDGSTTYLTGGSVIEPAGPDNDLRVNYSIAKGVLEPGEKFTVSYRVVTNSDLAPGTEIFNTATVNWTESGTSVTDTASIEIGGAPGVGVVGGNVWHDIIRSPAGVFTSSSDISLQDWTVRIYLNNPSLTLFAETTTDENGAYQFKGLPPSLNGGEYELRFVSPDGSDTSASMGPGDVDPRGAIAGIAGEMRITDITINQGVNIAQENMPIIPTGVVYDAIRRTPVTGATLSLVYNDGTNLVPVPASCLPANSNQQAQLTTASGFYRFDIQAQAAGCTVTDFEIHIDSVPVNYVAGTSAIIPPGKAGNVQLDVSACSLNSTDDTIPGNGDCDVQFAITPPGIDVAVRTDSTEEGIPGATQGTSYFLSKRVTTNGQVAFNNHIPLDPELSTVVSISKVSSMLNVTRSQLVPYTITLRNNFSAPLTNTNIEDQFPAGFKYVAGSGRIQIGNGSYIKTEPVHNADSLTLTWQGLETIAANTTVKIKLLLVVGSGVGEGEYINRARARNSLNGSVTVDALATVRVVPDPTFDCSDVIGKVFDDKNLNAYQDEGEKGLAGVRVLTARGLEITTDAYGRFHVTCAVVPNPDRGSNFILKLDERSLPTGYRLTTENPRVVRATRGKMVKFNFGAAIHRVVRLDMANEVFEPGTTTMRPQWLPRLDILISELAKDPSLLRLSYLADNESTGEVNDRLNVVKDEIQKRWETLNCCYQLTIETEVLWRKGGPPDRGGFND